jgi:hypothetical protein
VIWLACHPSEISRPGAIASAMIARRSGAGAPSTAAAPNDLSAPVSPVPLISFSGGRRGIR